MTKPTKWFVHPAKTPISLGIRPVWSEASLSTWRKLGSLATHSAHSGDSDQTGRMPRLIWVFPGCTDHFVGFVMRWLIYSFKVFSMESDKEVQGYVYSVVLTFAGSLRRNWNIQPVASFSGPGRHQCIKKQFCLVARATEILKSKSVRSTDDVIRTCIRQSQIVTKTDDSSFSSKNVSEIDYFSNTL